MRLEHTLMALTATGVLALGGVAQAATIQIDFGDKGDEGETTSLPDWNTITDKSQDIADLIDSTGATTGVSLDQEDAAFINTSDRGPAAPGAPASNFFPGAVTTDGIFGFADLTGNSDDANGNGETDITFGGLDLAQTYDFIIFASRPGSTDNRSGRYTAAGLNSQSGTLEAANNDSEILTLSGITPDANGEILFSVVGTEDNDSDRIYLNGLVINSSGVIPEPASLALLGLGSLTMFARRRRSV